MAQCVTVDASTGVLTASSTTETACTDYLLSSADEYRQMFSGLTTLTLQALGIDYASILYVYSWGMGSVIFFWSLGFAVGAAVDAIKKA